MFMDHYTFVQRDIIAVLKIKNSVKLLIDKYIRYTERVSGEQIFEQFSLDDKNSVSYQ
jgi:hypothetical protein